MKTFRIELYPNLRVTVKNTNSNNWLVSAELPNDKGIWSRAESDFDGYSGLFTSRISAIKAALRLSQRIMELDKNEY